MYPALLAVFLLSGSPALDEVLEQAAANAPARAIRAAELDVARAEARAAGAWQDPLVRFRADELGGVDSMGPRTLWQVEQPLELFGRRRLAKSAASARADASRASLRRAEWNARAGAFTLFHEIWMNDAMRALLAERIRLMERMHASATARYEAGSMMAHHDVLRSDAEIAQMRAELAGLEKERDGMSSMLNVLRGLPILEPVPALELPPRRPIPDPAGALSASSGAPELAGAGAMVDEMTARRSLARRMVLPMVMAGAMVEQSPDPAMGTTWGVEVSLTVPLWWFDRQRNEARAADAMLRRAHTESTAMRTMIAADARMAWARADAADRKLRALEETAVPRMREAAAASEAAYIAGAGNFLTLLETVQAVRELEMSRLEAVVHRETAIFELSRIAGTNDVGVDVESRTP